MLRENMLSFTVVVRCRIDFRLFRVSHFQSVGANIET